MVELTFEGRNPYNEGNYNYSNRGYIRLDSTKKKYMVYVTGSPKEVERYKDVIAY